MTINISTIVTITMMMMMITVTIIIASFMIMIIMLMMINDHDQTDLYSCSGMTPTHWSHQLLVPPKKEKIGQKRKKENSRQRKMKPQSGSLPSSPSGS